MSVMSAVGLLAQSYCYGSVDDDSLIAAHTGTEGVSSLALKTRQSQKSKHQPEDHHGNTLLLYLFKLSRLGSAAVGPSFTLWFSPGLHSEPAKQRKCLPPADPSNAAPL